MSEERRLMEGIAFEACSHPAKQNHPEDGKLVVDDRLALDLQSKDVDNVLSRQYRF